MFIVNWLFASFFILVISNVQANSFKIGETVFVAYPAGNIKDDAFIVGKVTAITDTGDYQLSVIEYVKGHDYGVSCVPMVKNDGSHGNKGDIWSLWTDTTELNTEELDYLVSKEDVLKLGYGKTYFIERNNLYIVFGRWLSGAPMLNIDRINRAIKTAKINRLEQMESAFELAKLQRKSFYDASGRPLYPFETIKPMLTVMQRVDQHFKDDPELEKLWWQRPRDWGKLNSDTRRYFLVQAIDRVYEDAWNQVYEDGIERADATDIEKLMDYVKKYKR